MEYICVMFFHMKQHDPKNHIIAFLFILLTGCSQSDNQPEGKPNGLINESSPYLLQHAYNPVDWQPWQEATLQKAQVEDKLVIVSIGYAACHWCHVMEKESFSDSAVAEVMNDNFVSIKVDREERPDVDQVYMDAALLMNGRGGWPLNIIALPDGKPVYAGTYFPKDNWVKVLDYFKEAYTNDRLKLIDQGKKVAEGITTMESIDLKLEEVEFTSNVYDKFYDRTILDIDLRKGGRRGAPKFPTPIVFESLLLTNYHSGKEKAIDAVNITLKRMANGGIYDHLGGGFARYSTDANWKVPHFEKMLYDNAQLVSLYSHAFQKTGDPQYAEVVEETIKFLNRDLRDKNGGYYSSLDADTEGEEGKFYVWGEKEVQNILGDQAESFITLFQINEAGNWEDGKNVLHKRQGGLENLAKQLNLDVSTVQTQLEESKEKLFRTRSKRVSPPLDNKILTSWNALMISGLTDAYFAFGNEEYLADALETGTFIMENQMREDGGLNRSFKDGKSSINAFLDDYSFSIEAFIKLYQATFNEDWLSAADRLMSYAKDQFMDKETQMFYYTSSSDDPLIARKMELADNVIPSSNSSMAHGLFLLGHYYYREEDIKQSKQMLNNMMEQIVDSPYYYSNWIRLYARMAYPFYEVAIVGEEADERRDDLFRNFIPNALIVGGKDEGTLELLANKLSEGRTMIYVCENKTCKLPVQEPERASQLIAKNNPQRISTGG